MQKLLQFFRLLLKVAICFKNVYNSNVRFCVYMCLAQHRLYYSFFNQRRQTTLSSMHTMQVWVSKHFYVTSWENVCVYITHIHSHTNISRIDVTKWNIKFENIKTSTFEDLRYSAHALIYFFIVQFLRFYRRWHKIYSHFVV